MHGSPLGVQGLNFIPCARGSLSLQLMVFVCRRIYAFQASLPLSRPPPVSFSPPNAPPISAPLVPMFTLAMPQSLPLAERNNSASRRLVVMIDDDKPCTTPFCNSTASSIVE